MVALRQRLSVFPPSHCPRALRTQMPLTLQTAAALPVRALTWLGGQGTRAVAALVFLGIALPPVGELLKPFVTEAIFVLLCISFMRVDPGALRDHLRRPGLVLAATAWTILAVPLISGSISLAGRPRCARAGSVPGADAAGRGLADDGGARACGIDGAGFDAGAGHAGDQHGAGALHRAAVRLSLLRRRADAVAARARIEAGRDPRRRGVGRARQSAGASANPPSSATRARSTGSIS